MTAFQRRLVRLEERLIPRAPKEGPDHRLLWLIAHLRIRLYPGIDQVEEKDCPTRRCWCEIEELRAAAAGDRERARRFAAGARYPDEDGLSLREVVARIPHRPGKREIRQAIENAKARLRP